MTLLFCKKLKENKIDRVMLRRNKTKERRNKPKDKPDDG